MEAAESPSPAITQGLCEHLLTATPWSGRNRDPVTVALLNSKPVRTAARQAVLPAVDAATEAPAAHGPGGRRAGAVKAAAAGALTEPGRQRRRDQRPPCCGVCGRGRDLNFTSDPNNIIKSTLLAPQTHEFSHTAIELDR